MAMTECGHRTNSIDFGPSLHSLLYISVNLPPLFQVAQEAQVTKGSVEQGGVERELPGRERDVGSKGNTGIWDQRTIDQAVGSFTFRVAYDAPPQGIPFASLLGPLRPFGAPFCRVEGEQGCILVTRPERSEIIAGKVASVEAGQVRLLTNQCRYNSL